MMEVDQEASDLNRRDIDISKRAIVFLRADIIASQMILHCLVDRKHTCSWSKNQGAMTHQGQGNPQASFVCLVKLILSLSSQSLHELNISRAVWDNPRES
jgi:hypothetical protein